MLLALIFLVHFQFFFYSGSEWDVHLLSFKFLFEAYVGINLVLAMLLILFVPWTSLLVGVIGICLLSVLFMTTSALAANINFGQPLHFGLIETRRCLSFFCCATFYYFGVVARPNLVEIRRALFICVSIQLVLALSNQHIFSSSLLSRNLPDLDTRKLRIANGAYAFACISVISACMMTRDKFISSAAQIAIGLIGLFFVSQSKSLFGMALLASSIMIAAKSKLAAISFAMVSMFMLCAGLLLISSGHFEFSSFVDKVMPGFGFGDLINSGDNVRSSTLNTIMKELKANNYFGLGALSLQWNSGFAPLYGEHFFLADVGTAGEVFQVGFLYPIFLGILIIFIWFTHSSAQDATAKRCIIGISLLIFVVSPLGGVFFQFGFLVSFIVLLSTATPIYQPFLKKPAGRRPQILDCGKSKLPQSF